MSLIQAPTKYTHLTGSADFAYDAICKTLSERVAQVDWNAFDQNDWQLFAQIADTEGVAPLLHWQVKTGVITDEWPAEVCQYLQTSYYKNTAHNALLFQELERILAAFESAQIPVIALKGAALAQTVYPELGLRPMNDIDIAVDPENFKKSLQILKNLDFALWKMSYHTMMVGGINKSITVELHWCFFSPIKQALEISQLFSNRFDDRLQNLRGHLLHLCAHIYYQHFGLKSRLLWGYDLYALITKQEIDWKALIAEATYFGWEDAILTVLTWLRETFNLTMPSELSQTIQEHNFRPAETGLTEIKLWMRQAFTLLPPRQKFTWLQGMLFPSVDYIRCRYNPEPDWLWPIYLIKRGWEIAR